MSMGLPFLSVASARLFSARAESDALVIDAMSGAKLVPKAAIIVIGMLFARVTSGCRYLPDGSEAHVLN